MRTIDADVFKAKWGLGDKCETCEADPRVCAKRYYTQKELCEMIDDAPTVETKDAVPRCVKCLHYHPEGAHLKNGIPLDDAGYCELLERIMAEMDYCSYHTGV